MSLRFDSDKKLRKQKKQWKKKIRTPEDYEEMENHFLKEKLKYEEPTIKGSIRIIAGKAKGIQIDIPRGTRPVTDRMKTRIFDQLREDIANRDVLDLYAGSGSFSIEALSRGAKFAKLVDNSRHAERILVENVRRTGFISEAEIERAKVEQYLPWAIGDKEEYEVIFIDPPYKLFNTKDFTRMEELLGQTKQLLPGYNNWNTKKYKGVIIIKHPRRYPINEINIPQMNVFETYDFGTNAISILALNQPE